MNVDSFRKTRQEILMTNAQQFMALSDIEHIQIVLFHGVGQECIHSAFG